MIELEVQTDATYYELHTAVYKNGKFFDCAGIVCGNRKCSAGRGCCDIHMRYGDRVECKTCDNPCDAIKRRWSAAL